MNTAISDVLIDNTVNPISFDPSIAASNGDIPSSRCRLMFSITTIASSTTNPVEIVNAISDKLSSVYPSRYITANVPSRLKGTATVGISVDRTSRRNRNTTMITSRIEITSVRVTSLTEARIVVVLSIATCT